MSSHPKIELSRLREIGWTLWDPIGLKYLLEEGNDSVADEYDSYLLQAAGRLWNGASVEEVTNYLVTVELDHMGLSDAPGVRPKARETVNALSEYVSELRG